MQIFLHRACWAAKRGDKIFGVLRHNLFWSLSANLQEYLQMATFRIFRRVQFEHTSNAMFCNFPLNFAVWPQPSRFLKAEIQICAFLRGVAPCLRACFGPECITLLLKKMSMGLDGEELKQIRTKTPKVRHNCSWAKSRTSTKKLGELCFKCLAWRHQTRKSLRCCLRIAYARTSFTYARYSTLRRPYADKF